MYIMYREIQYYVHYVQRNPILSTLYNVQGVPQNMTVGE